MHPCKDMLYSARSSRDPGREQAAHGSDAAQLSVSVRASRKENTPRQGVLTRKDGTETNCCVPRGRERAHRPGARRTTFRPGHVPSETFPLPNASPCFTKKTAFEVSFFFSENEYTCPVERGLRGKLITQPPQQIHGSSSQKASRFGRASRIHVKKKRSWAIKTSLTRTLRRANTVFGLVFVVDVCISITYYETGLFCKLRRCYRRPLYLALVVDYKDYHE